MHDETARSIASHWLAIEPESDQDLRWFEVMVGLSALPDLEAWTLAPVDGDQSEPALLGLATGRLYKFATREGEDAAFTTVITPVEDVRLTITDSVSAHARMRPLASYRDGRVERVWHFHSERWDVHVRATRDWPDDQWSWPGRSCDRLVEALGLAPSVPQAP